MLNKISKVLSKYKVERYKLDTKVNFVKYLKSTFASILFTILIMLIPALLIYNLFILEYLHSLLKVIIVIFMPVISFLYNYLFIKLIKSYEESLENVDFKHLIIIESTVLSVFLIIITIVIISLI